MFLIDIDGLTKNLQANPNFFADDTSLFSIINDPNATTKQICEDLDKIKEWAFQWKMCFNPDPSKQAEEVIFIRKGKSLCIYQFSIMTNQFNKFHYKITWV